MDAEETVSKHLPESKRIVKKGEELKKELDALLEFWNAEYWEPPGTQGRAPTPDDASNPLDRREARVATVFWQVLIRSPAYPRTLWAAGIPPDRQALTEPIVVGHYADERYEYHLLVLDPSENRPITGLRVDPSWDELDVGLKAWRAFLEEAHANLDFLKFSSEITTQFLFRLAHLVDFGIVVAPTPVIKPTAEICYCVEDPYDDSLVGTVGVISENHEGRVGATIAHHILDSRNLTKDGEIGLRVRGFEPTLISADEISDSCFVSADFLDGRALLTHSGPLRNTTPRGGEPARFVGAKSGEKRTLVRGWSPDIPVLHRKNQLKVFTQPSTVGGDSGAALISEEGHILGFSFWRTDLGADIQMSAWIWADSVYAAHQLKRSAQRPMATSPSRT